MMDDGFDDYDHVQVRTNFLLDVEPAGAVLGKAIGSALKQVGHHSADKVARQCVLWYKR